VPKSAFDYITEINGWLAIVSFWALVFILNFNTHLLVLCILSTLLYIGIGQLLRYPHLLNYPVKITEQNALRQYTLSTRFLRYLKMIIVLIFFGVGLNIIISPEQLQPWVAFVVLGLTIIPLIIFIAASRRVG
jgi:hypothetical protein